MSTLVQSNNQPHYPQMANGDRQARPSNVSTKSLSSTESQNLFDILGSNCIVKQYLFNKRYCFFLILPRQTLATAVAQVLHANNGTWRKQACGVFCYVKDYDNKYYYLRLYDLKVNRNVVGCLCFHRLNFRRHDSRSMKSQHQVHFAQKKLRMFSTHLTDRQANEK